MFEEGREGVLERAREQVGRKVRAVGKEGNWISYSGQRESWEALEQNMDVSDLHCSKARVGQDFLNKTKRKSQRRYINLPLKQKFYYQKNPHDLKSEAINKHKTSQCFISRRYNFSP